MTRVHYLRLPEELWGEIQRNADQEQRSLNNMTMRLLWEAVRIRQNETTQGRG